MSQAADDEEALQKIEGQAPDLILMDLQMPVSNGLEVMRTIKERWPEIKVVILTIYPDYQAQAQQAGADAFLVKRGSMEVISSTICLLN